MRGERTKDERQPGAAPGRSEATRARLLEAATRAFARYGLRKTSIDAVAELAGVSRQHVYNHWSSKEALFTAAVESLQVESLESALQSTREVRAAGGDAIDEVVAAVVRRTLAFADSLKGSPHLDELLDERNRLSGELLRKRRHECREKLAALVAERRSAGKFQLPRSESSARFIDDAFVFAAGLQGVGETDLERFCAHLERLLRLHVAGLHVAANSK